MADKIVLLDTSVLIEYFRKKDKTCTVLYKIVANNHHLAISAITYFEYLVGSKGGDFDKQLLSIIEVISFDDKQATVASQIYRNLKTRNQLVEFRDIFIASCAIQRDLELATLNKKHFEVIDEVRFCQL